MLNTKTTLFPGHIQSVYYQNILKIIIYLIQSSNNDETLIQQLLSLAIVLFDDVLNPIVAKAQSFWIWMTETTSDTINGNDCIELTLSQGTNATIIHDNDDDIYPTVKVTHGGELPENATESENTDNDNDVRVEKNKKYDPYRALNIDLNEKPIQSIPTPSSLTFQLKESVPKQKKKIIEKQEQLSTSKSKHKRERSNDKELLSPADEEENRPTSSTPSPPPPATAEKTKVKKSSSETTTIVYTNTSVPLLLDIMMDDIHPTNQSEQQYNEQDTYKLAAQSDNLTIEYLINPDPLIVQVDVTFLLKNRISFIIDHINIHVIHSMSSKLLNTTNTNLISFPSISLFSHSQNYIHIYFLINAISLSQELKTTLTYSINKLNIIETDRIEFKLNLPCSRYLRRKTIDSQE
ncbi:unnamed protein product [Rotaria sordida]|uniref:Uncharacterized protein n=1 Tax=Rotaria sordida TaxID=392033 RepID=A0A815ENY2_9BILA|nr:unnamed protein product [Rotaria sordida]CAF1582364.1 unnamed protein product [Rotaria sordida]